MKTYDEIVDNVIEATAVHRRRVRRAQHIAATSAMCMACVFGLSVYLNLEPQNTLPEFSETETQTIVQTIADTETTEASGTSSQTTATGTVQETATDVIEPTQPPASGTETAVTNAETRETAISAETSREAQGSSAQIETQQPTEEDPTDPPVITTDAQATTRVTTFTTRRTSTTRVTTVTTRIAYTTTKMSFSIPDIHNTDPSETTMSEGDTMGTAPPTEDMPATTTTTTTTTADLAKSMNTATTEVITKDTLRFAGSYEESGWFSWIDLDTGLEPETTAPETDPFETETIIFL